MILRMEFLYAAIISSSTPNLDRTISIYKNNLLKI